jgi:putative membrane protein
MYSHADSFDAKGADDKPQPVRPSFQLPATLLALFVAIWLAFAISPISRQDWLLENLLLLIAIPALVATRQRMRFSNASYVCLFVFFVLHSVGAHYTYSLVPYDRWWEMLTGSTLNELFGWQRNHYDRLVHFLYGMLVLPPAAELFDQYAPSRGAWRGILPVLFVMSHSVVYEIVEWIAALIVAPELGDAYLGTQGDHWDAQQDMALATAGSVLSMLFVSLRGLSFRRAP